MNGRPVPTEHTMPDPTEWTVFEDQLRAAIANGRWNKLILAKPRKGSSLLQRVVIRPVLLRGETCLQFVYSHATKDITKNLSTADGIAHIADLLSHELRNGHLFTPDGETQCLGSKKGHFHVIVHAKPAAPASTPADLSVLQTPAVSAMAHDRPKWRALELHRPFLQALGITSSGGHLVPAMSRKWKQINKFLEIFGHALDHSALAQAPELKIVDFGAGKAYLAFALHDWLTHTRQRPVQVVGVELRDDLVQQGNQIVADLGLSGMSLQQGDVRDWPVGQMDVMVALHACDTATDHAIHLGIRSGAQLILCSPCCHKQLRPQLLSPHPLRSIFQHGIHAEQQAEMLTDSLRALLLEAHGYDTQVFEFVSQEHTRKNKMILAVKRVGQPARAEDALAKVAELKRFFSIREHCLEQLLQGA